MSVVRRTDLYRLIDELPEFMLPEVSRFLEFLFFKLGRKPSPSSSYTPVKLGGLWHEITINDAEIAKIRQEIWQGFGESVE